MKITDIFVVVCLRVLTKHKNSVCVLKCVSREVRQSIQERTKARLLTEDWSRQHIPAVSVADKLQGLAATSGPQVALQDRVH